MAEARRFNTLKCGRRWGKALNPSTDIFTYNRGWIKFGEIKIGDSVVSSDGKPCNVVFVTPLHKNEYYRLKLITGEEIICCKDHNWITHAKNERKKGERRIYKDPSIKTTKQIADSLRYGLKKPENNHIIYLVQPVEFPKKELPINPYILGYWLGDGTSRISQLTIGEKDLAEVSELYLERGSRVRKLSAANSFSFNTGKRRDKNSITLKLKSLNLLKNKHIPAQYLTADIESRMELLRGLNDSDGYADILSNKVEFTTITKSLAEQYFELAAGLGFKCVKSEGSATIAGKYICKKYRITYSTDRKVFNIHRKQRRLFRKPNGQSNCRSIISCDPIGDNEGLCIMVDSPDNTYCITKSFIVTHNTTLSQELLISPDDPENGALNGYPVAYFAPTYKMLMEVWREIVDTLYEITEFKSETEKQIRIFGGGIIDFWSLEDPNAIRGRKYKRVVLDEAEVARNLKEAWQNVIRPTLADLKGDAWFLSTPKFGGTYFKHLAKLDDPEWMNWSFTTYDNPFIDKAEIDSARNQLDESTFRCEFLAEDVTLAVNKFIYNFDRKKHVVPGLQYLPKMPVILSLDFNTEPITCLVGQCEGLSRVRILDEYRLMNSDIEELCTRILSDYPNQMLLVTGDASGQNRTALKRDLNYYKIIKQVLRLGMGQFRLPAANPPIKNTRVLVNSLLGRHPDFLFSDRVPYLIMDIEECEVDEHGNIDKAKDKHQSHLLDCFRYFCWSFLNKYLDLRIYDEATDVHGERNKTNGADYKRR